MIRWPRRQETRPLEPKITSLMELETAKQILEEIFHARLSEVDEMIQMRLDEKNWREEEESWPREFCLG
jgi:hypothetical protein